MKSSQRSLETVFVETQHYVIKVQAQNLACIQIQLGPRQNLLRYFTKDTHHIIFLHLCHQYFRLLDSVT